MKTSKTGPRLKKPGGEGLLRASPFLLPSLIGLAIFYLAPMVVSIFISLTDWNGLDRLFADGFMQEHFIGLDNYKAILTSQEFWKVLKNTLTYIVLYLPLMINVIKIKTAQSARQLPQVSEKVYFCGSSPFCA